MARQDTQEITAERERSDIGGINLSRVRRLARLLPDQTDQAWRWASLTAYRALHDLAAGTRELTELHSARERFAQAPVVVTDHTSAAQRALWRVRHMREL